MFDYFYHRQIQLCTACSTQNNLNFILVVVLLLFIAISSLCHGLSFIALIIILLFMAKLLIDVYAFSGGCSCIRPLSDIALCFKFF